MIGVPGWLRVGMLPGLCLLALLLARPALANDAEQTRLQRQQLNKAWAAARGSGQDWLKLAAGLERHVLWPYLEYAALERRIDAATQAEVSTFIETHADSPLAGRLRTRALQAWAKSNRHADFLALWPATAVTDPALRCAAWTALHQARPQTLEALRAAAVLWRETPKAEPACSGAFAALETAGQLPAEQRLARIEAAFEAGDLKLVGWLLAKLPAAQAQRPARRLKLRQGGLAALAQTQDWADDASTRELLAEAVQRGARRDPRGAEVWRLKLAQRARFDPAQQQTMQEAIALAAAIDNLEEAAGWLRRLPVPYQEPRLSEWATRYWLGRGDLAAALPVLAQMPEPLRDQPRWRYAHGRVLELSGEAEAAKQHYRAIATDTGFFPFLAADRLGVDYALCEAPFADDPELQNALAARGPWQRAMELRALGMNGPAVSEIQFLLTDLGSAERVQLAAMLVHSRWYEMAVTALGSPAFQRYYSLRFPRPWARNIDRNAQRNELDSNWTSGLIRAESAFNRQAVSTANARGLMQLLPGTARQLAGPRGPAPDLFSPLVNLRLGTRYLRQQFDRFDGDPLATTAAYNAGPGAVKRWLPKASRQWPELWVETIPYHETRDYVARVLAFSVIYDWRSEGAMTRLGARLGLLEPTPVKAVCPP